MPPARRGLPYLLGSGERLRSRRGSAHRLQRLGWLQWLGWLSGGTNRGRQRRRSQLRLGRGPDRLGEVGRLRLGIRPDWLRTGGFWELGSVGLECLRGRLGGLAVYRREGLRGGLNRLRMLLARTGLAKTLVKTTLLTRTLFAGTRPRLGWTALRMSRPCGRRQWFVGRELIPELLVRDAAERFLRPHLGVHVGPSPPADAVC
jgi:hypothetical protein